MQKYYRRNHVFSVLLLIPAVLFGLTFYLQMSMSNPAGYVTLIAAFIFLINAIWSFTTPAAVQGEKSIYINQSMFKKKAIFTSNIERMDDSSGISLKIYMKDKSLVKVSLLAMTIGAKKRFRNAVREIAEQNATDSRIEQEFAK